jgi:hypothetical protein
VILTGWDSYFTQGTRVDTLYRNPYDFGRASTLEKLESRNPIRPQRIPTELPRSSYEVGSRQVRRPSNPQSLATLLTRLRLATTLRMRALQVEFPKWGVSVDFHREGGIYRGEWDLHRHGEVSLLPGGGRVAKPHGRPTEWSGFH